MLCQDRRPGVPRRGQGMGTTRGPCVWPRAPGTLVSRPRPSWDLGIAEAPCPRWPGSACGALEGTAVMSPVSCSTTHWKQVLFMMDEPVPVCTGDVVTGSVVLQRNPVWRRHMSVALRWSVTSRHDPTSQKVRDSAAVVLHCWSRDRLPAQAEHSGCCWSPPCRPHGCALSASFF